VTLPEILLDDRDFQSLVDEARLRIAATCPEWTEHNVSDPGITLIELFAWMTDLLIYRVNRIPDKLQLALLNLLQVELGAPRAAEARLRFSIAGVQAIPVLIPSGTQVAAPGDPGAPLVVFTVRDDTEVAQRSLAALHVHRSGAGTALSVIDGVGRPAGPDRSIFSTPPAVGDALLLGVRQPIGELVLDIDVVAQPAHGTAIRPAAPPLSWEVSGPGNSWLPAAVIHDTSGGFNFTTGTVRLEIPTAAAPATVGGTTMHWLRCRVADAIAPDLDQYVRAPVIDQLTLSVAGATVWADHQTVRLDEFIGHSDGTPGQRFVLQHQPTLPLDDDFEHLDVRDPATQAWIPWARVDSLAGSTALDRVYAYDPVAGELQLGVAVRVTGGWRQFGAIPQAGAALRMSRYRFGGGCAGNVGPGTLTRLRGAIPGVTSVTNPRVARGGVDSESLDEACIRAPKELRTRDRAVTAADYELLVHRECPRAARVRCGTPAPGQAIPLFVLPVLADARGRLKLDDLTSPPELLAEVGDVLRSRCVLGVSVNVAPVAIRLVAAAVEIGVARHDEILLIEQLVRDALYEFINPYIGGDPLQAGDGWHWGRSLHAGELAPVVRRVPGVLRVHFVRLYDVDPTSGLPSPRELADGLQLGPHELPGSGEHRVHATVGERP
jgi:predicted phage baseplate assembly protein